MKKILTIPVLLLSSLLVLSSCDKEGKGGSSAGPDIDLKVESTTAESVTFTLSATGAEALAYKVLAEYDAQPSAEEILKSGTAADPSVFQTYTASGLAPATVYRIAAAARSAEGKLSAVKEVSAKTSEKQAIVPTLVLRDVTPGSTSVSFTLVPDKAAEVCYVCVPSEQGIPDADYIFAKGQQARPDATDLYVVAGLSPLADYVLAAAAKSSDGTVSEVSSYPFSTLKPEPVAIGDWYYADGTWSSGSEAPVSGKTVIGVVVLSGRSTEAEGVDDCTYFTKDGKTRLDDINGYVVALNDVTDGDTDRFQWGSWDVDGEAGAETSFDNTDFRGYFNTKQIKAKAASKSGGLANEPKNNYPAAWAASVQYEQLVPSPASSTGWFLPSAKQINYLYLNHTKINAALEALGDEATLVYRRDAEYWSSSEQWTQNGCRYWAYFVNLDEAVFDPGYINGQQKTKEFKVRAWLVF